MDRDLARALLESYHDIRPFNRAERQYWQDLLCFAATRFWVSRLLAVHAPQATPGNSALKEPDVYRGKLRQRLIGCPALPH